MRSQVVRSPEMDPWHWFSGSNSDTHTHTLAGAGSREWCSHSTQKQRKSVWALCIDAAAAAPPVSARLVSDKHACWTNRRTAHLNWRYLTKWQLPVIICHHNRASHIFSILERERKCKQKWSKWHVLLMKVVLFRPVLDWQMAEAEQGERRCSTRTNRQEAGEVLVITTLDQHSPPPPPTRSWIMEQKEETMFESEYFLICIINIQYSLHFPT